MKIKLPILILALFVLSFAAHSQEKLFYLTPDVTETYFSKEQLLQITMRAKQIDILGPQVFQMDETGLIWGTLDSKLLAIAKEQHLKVMPLVTNVRFQQEPFHQFLHDAAAQEKAIASMLMLCKQHALYGLQLDFENINIADKDALTHFVQSVAARLHQNGFTLSIAVVPRGTEIYNSDYDRWYYENWSGAYDYRSLSESCDFLSLMTYDEHTSLTTPGPLATYSWVKSALEAILKEVSPNKISLGIPSYSGYWFTGKLDPGKLEDRYTFRSKEAQISYAKVQSLLNTFNKTLTWQDQWKSSYAFFMNQEKMEYLFVENARSFQERENLAIREHLRGISIWKLGMEDPEVWKH